MATTNFKTENNTFRKLIGNGLTYKIPRFQRDYSWDLEQWEDLWADILSILKGDEDFSHYMGYLVLQSTDDKSFDVIDGQQRLTTSTLIILAILKNLQRLIDEGIDSERNKQRLDQIRQTYIGYLDPVTLISRSKLTLNRNNNDYFQTYLVPLGHLPQRGFRASEHLLRKAFEWFDKQVANYLKNTQGEKGKVLAQLVEDISDGLFFTVITVTDELNAYKVFETLNARGVRLSSTDLLKNYLFSVLDKSQESLLELKNLEDRWESMVSRLQSEKFPDFLRTHWNSRYKLSRQAELFKTIRNNVNDRETVFSLIRGMEEDLDHYLALSSPEASNWPQNDKQAAVILKMCRVKQPFSLLLAAKRKFSAENFSELLRAIKVISFRYNTIGAYSPTEQERIYNTIAEQISQDKITLLSQVWPLLKPIYIDDARFKADFAEKVIKTTDSRTKRIVRYILCALEKQCSGSEYDFSSDSFNIEHVLPQNAPDGWGGFNNDESNALVYRLGNMTLLQSGTNRDLGTLDYLHKRPVFQQSNFEITRKLANDYMEWTAEKILSRQIWMANQAITVWRVSQLN
ncbi:hypothetical protein QV08_10515 [Gallibacterium salpingitidis]|uniref:DUF262 domain-containing protein n=1 Tax=Gallibacterium salpingitidis TaxID=505341 RepID=A0A1A7PYV5_9PAST|nr:DUF262 domain-containing protein [Gallibacterium salpingitidis]OBW91312.1 hypothetical protein QS62_10740 [Gallibacterium salpingitidis]OBX06335.1 hypothetical protein QV08_10515 [Gallibacterium salpingitidis]OBX09955.1 hypothetical protein QV09_07110 [Gallibacterium salpingitidis]